MKRFIWLLTLLLVATLSYGCNGSDDGGSDETTRVSIDELSGDYDLTGMTVIYDNGDIVTESDYDQLEGTMRIQTTGALTKEFVRDGESQQGQSWILYVDDYEMQISNSRCESYWVDIDYSAAGTLIITTLSGAICGQNDAQITEYWQKY